MQRFQGDLVTTVFLNVRTANANPLFLEPDVPLSFTWFCKESEAGIQKWKFNEKLLISFT